MDSTYCCWIATKKFEDIVSSPISYIANDIRQFFYLTFSGNWFHSVPTFVFLVSTAIFIRNHRDFIFYPLQSLKIQEYKWAVNFLKFTVVFTPILICFCMWMFLQELVYCMAWFLTTENINPGLREKWWFRKGNSTSKSNESIKIFTEVVPPEVLSWIIMTLTASLILVMVVNDTAQNHKMQQAYETLFCSSAEHSSSINELKETFKKEKIDSDDSDVDGHERMFGGVNTPSTSKGPTIFNSIFPTAGNICSDAAPKFPNLFRRNPSINANHEPVIVVDEDDNDADDDEDDDDNDIGSDQLSGNNNYNENNNNCDKNNNAINNIEDGNNNNEIQDTVNYSTAPSTRLRRRTMQSEKYRPQT